MRGGILFLDVSPDTVESVIQRVAGQGWLPIVSSGAAARALEAAGVTHRTWQELAPPGLAETTREQMTRIQDGLARALSGSGTGEAGESAGEAILPGAGRTFFTGALRLMANQVAAIETLGHVRSRLDLRLLVLGCDNTHVQRALIARASAQGIPSLQLAHGIYAPPSFGRIAGEMTRLYSERIAAYGPRARELLIGSGVDPGRIECTGAPAWDVLFRPGARPGRGQACSRLGLDPQRPVLALLSSYGDGSTPAYLHDLRGRMRIYAALSSALAKVSPEPQLMIRPHPHELARCALSAAQTSTAIEHYRRWLSSVGLGSARVLLDHKIELLRAADLVLAEGESTAAVESIILGRPVAVIPHLPELLLYRGEDGIPALTPETLAATLPRLLQDGEEQERLAARQARALPSLHHGNDGRAGERVAKLIELLATGGRGVRPAREALPAPTPTLPSDQRPLLARPRALPSFPSGPGDAEAHYRHGLLLGRSKRYGEALDAFEQALRCDPAHAGARLGRATALMLLGRHEEALAAFDEVLRHQPGSVEARVDRGWVLEQLGRPREALHAYEQALRCDPLEPRAHLNRAIVRLQCGDFAAGWPEYEWRWRTPGFPARPRGFPQPRWDGGPLCGRTLLLHAEQGLGDTIQFSRYAPLVAGAGGRVVLECPPSLTRLLASIPGIERIVPGGDPLPSFDVHAPLLSLPALLGTTLESIPRAIPYLAPPPGAEPAGAPGPSPEGIRVGIVWAGAAGHVNDPRRSVALERFRVLLDVPGVTLLGLQVGERGADLRATPGFERVPDLAPRIHDFADTAAIIAGLDLVISVDTAVAHLAGALGQPVWTLLPFPADWRWLLDRDDSPWYPGMRLFRQVRRGDWDEVFVRVRAELEVLARARP